MYSQSVFFKMQRKGGCHFLPLYKCVSQNVFLKMYFSKCISQNAKERGLPLFATLQMCFHPIPVTALSATSAHLRPILKLWSIMIQLSIIITETPKRQREKENIFNFLIEVSSWFVKHICQCGYIYVDSEMRLIPDLNGITRGTNDLEGLTGKTQWIGDNLEGHVIFLWPPN